MVSNLSNIASGFSKQNELPPEVASLIEEKTKNTQGNVNIFQCNFENIAKLVDYLGIFDTQTEQQSVDDTPKDRQKNMINSVNDVHRGYVDIYDKTNELKQQSLDIIGADAEYKRQENKQRKTFIDKILFYLDFISNGVFEFLKVFRIIRERQHAQAGFFAKFSPTNIGKSIGDFLSKPFKSLSNSFDNFKTSFQESFSSPKGIFGKMIFGLKSVFVTTLSGLFGKSAAERRHKELTSKVQEGNISSKHTEENTGKLVDYYFGDDSDAIDDKKTKKFIKKTYKEQRHTSKLLKILVRQAKNITRIFSGWGIGDILRGYIAIMQKTFKSYKDGFIDMYRQISWNIRQSLSFLDPTEWWWNFKQIMSNLGSTITHPFKMLAKGFFGFLGGIAGWFGGKKRINREFLRDQLIEPLLEILRDSNKFQKKFAGDLMHILKLIEKKPSGGGGDGRLSLQEREDRYERRRREEQRYNEFGNRYQSDIDKSELMAEVMDQINKMRQYSDKPSWKDRLFKGGLLGLLGLGAGTGMSWMAERQSNKQYEENKDINWKDYFLNMGAGITSGASLGATKWGLPGALVGGLLGGIGSGFGTVILDAMPSKKEAKDARMEAWKKVDDKRQKEWDKQENESAIKRLQEKNILEHKSWGKSTIDESKLNELSIRELKALIDFDDFTMEDLIKIKKTLVRKMAHREVERRKQETEDKKEPSTLGNALGMYRDRKVEYQKQKEETLAALRTAGKSEEEIAKIEKEFDVASNLNVADNFLLFLDDLKSQLQASQKQQNETIAALKTAGKSKKEIEEFKKNFEEANKTNIVDFASEYIEQLKNAGINISESSTVQNIQSFMNNINSGDTINNLIESFSNLSNNVASTTANAVKETSDNLVSTASDVANKVSETASGAYQSVKETAINLIPEKKPPTMMEKASGMVSGATDAVVNAIMPEKTVPEREPTLGENVEKSVDKFIDTVDYNIASLKAMIYTKLLEYRVKRAVKDTTSSAFNLTSDFISDFLPQEEKTSPFQKFTDFVTVDVPESIKTTLPEMANAIVSPETRESISNTVNDTAKTVSNIISSTTKSFWSGFQRESEKYKQESDGKTFWEKIFSGPASSDVNKSEEVKKEELKQKLGMSDSNLFKLDPMELQTRSFERDLLQSVVDNMQMGAQNEIMNAASSMASIQNVSNSSNSSKIITINAPNNVYNNPHGDIFSGIKGTVSMNG